VLREFSADQRFVAPVPPNIVSTFAAGRPARQGGISSVNKLVSITDFRSAAPQSIALPYFVDFTVEGVCDLLFHRWNSDAIEEKAAAPKNSLIKRSDNLEAYVYRNDDGEIALPGEYLRGAVVSAARFRQDPRSPRKSAMDLFRAGVVSLTHLAPMGVKVWDYEDKRRVVVQRSGVNRVRPAMRRGWRASFTFQVNTPEYIEPLDLLQTLEMAGRLVGVGDFRPTFGRFIVTNSAVRSDFELAAA
jgi:hypothetical protein